VRITIVGAGATGAFLGARLARAGSTITLVARGPHLAAMRADGLQVTTAEEEFVVRPDCTDDLGAVRGADAIFLTVKAHALPELAPRLAPFLGAETAVVPAQNGIPWWYFARHGGPLEATRLESVDPGGVISTSIPDRQVIGSVVWPATRLVAPGHVEHVEGTRLTLGELDGGRSPRCEALAAALTAAGLKAPVSRDIRHDLWLKLLGNVAFNPMSALTRATMADLAADARARAILRAVMEEADGVARALGVRLKITIDQRLAGAEQVGAHRTSMLQDLEAGRPLEIEALVGAVVELGDLVHVPLPHLRTLYACARLLNRSQLARPPVSAPAC
jgi:2-dehydropantoate 2-reductase